jgi:lipoteichoic acid synthase
MHLKEVVWGAPDGDVMKKVLKKVHDSPKPFYYHFITMSSHEPFIFVEPYYSTKKFKTLNDKLAKRYYTCISYVDSVVYKFVNDIRHERPNTVFFIYGDHTPAIKDSKIYRQAGYKNDGLYFEFVPLIIITPDNKQHFEKKMAVSFLDIAPTVLESANIPYSISSLGENLLDPDSLKEEIPYRGVTFKRNELFKTVDDFYTKCYKSKLK